MPYFCIIIQLVVTLGVCAVCVMWHMTKSKNSTPSALEGDFRERKSNPLPEWLNDRPASHCEVAAEG